MLPKKLDTSRAVDSRAAADVEVAPKGWVQEAFNAC